MVACVFALKRQKASLKAALAKVPCPDALTYGIQFPPVPCALCGEKWTPEKGTKYYHGTALAAWEREQKEAKA